MEALANEVMVLEGEAHKGRYRYGVKKLLQFQPGNLSLIERCSAPDNKRYFLSFTREKQPDTSCDVVDLSSLRCVCLGAPGAKRKPFVFTLWIEHGREHVFRAPSESHFQEWLSALRTLCPPTRSQRLAAHVCNSDVGAAGSTLLEFHARGIALLRPSDEQLLECYQLEEISGFGYDLDTPLAWLELCPACRPSCAGRHNYRVMMGGGKRLAQHLQLVYQSQSHHEVTSCSQKGFESYWVKHSACIVNKRNCLRRPKQREYPGGEQKVSSAVSNGVWRLSRSLPAGLDNTAQDNESAMSVKKTAWATYPPNDTRAIKRISASVSLDYDGRHHSVAAGSFAKIASCSPVPTHSPTLTSDKTEEAMSDKVLRRLARKVVKCSTKSTSWKDIAFELGFSSEMIERKRQEMEASASNEVDRVYHFLSEWRDHGRKILPKQLLDALSGADMIEAAEYYAVQLGISEGERVLGSRPVVLARPYMVSDVVGKCHQNRPLSDSDYATEDSGGRQIQGQPDSVTLFSPPSSPVVHVKYRPRAYAMSSNTCPYRNRKKKVDDSGQVSAPAVRVEQDSVAVTALEEVAAAEEVTADKDTCLSQCSSSWDTHLPAPSPESLSASVTERTWLPIGPRYFGEPIGMLGTLPTPSVKKTTSFRQLPSSSNVEVLPCGVLSEAGYSMMHRPINPTLPRSSRAHRAANESRDDTDQYMELNPTARIEVLPPVASRLHRETAPPDISPFVGTGQSTKDFGDLLEVQAALRRADRTGFWKL